MPHIFQGGVMSSKELTKQETSTIAEVIQNFNAIGNLKFLAGSQIEAELRLGNKAKAIDIWNKFCEQLHVRIATISSAIRR